MKRTTLRISVWLFLGAIPAFAVFLSSCNIAADPSGLQRYRDIGTSADLHRWAIEKSDMRSIDGAMFVLIERAELKDQDAAVGLTDIHDRMLGEWPGLTYAAGAPMSPKDRHGIIRIIQGNLAKIGTHWDIAAEAFRRIEPPLDAGPPRQSWDEAAAFFGYK